MRTALLRKCQSRIVVKLGTGVLTDSRKQPDLAQLEQLAAQVAEQRQAGKEMVLVTSGRGRRGHGRAGLPEAPGRSWRNCRPAPPWASPG